MIRLVALALLLLSPSLSAEDIVVYRCAGDDGSLSFQDEPCAGGQVQREQRYEAPLPREAAPLPVDALPPAEPEPADDAGMTAAGVEPEPADAAESSTGLTLVPPLFTCAAFDGEVTISEQGDGNRRCVPLEITRIGSGTLPGVAQACEWVVDECRLLEAGAACDGWQTLQRRALRREREAFSDTLGEVREDLQRLTAIRDAACAR